MEKHGQSMLKEWPNQLVRWVERSETHQILNNPRLTQRSSGASLRSLALTTLSPLNFALEAGWADGLFRLWVSCQLGGLPL